MRKFFNLLILVPLGLILVVFAVANRHFVTVSFDPLDPADPMLSASVPLFAVIIAAAILGAMAGGSASWLGQRHWRRAARRHEAEARSVKAQLADFKASTIAVQGEPKRLGEPARLGLYGSTVRDKQGAAL